MVHQLGLYRDLGLVITYKRRGNISTILCNVQGIVDVKPYVAIDTFARVPARTLLVSIVIPHSNDIITAGDHVLAHIVGKASITVEVFTQVFAIHPYLRCAINALELEGDHLAFGTDRYEQVFAVPAYVSWTETVSALCR